MCPADQPKIDLESTEQDGWYGRRDRERIYSNFRCVTVQVKTGVGGMTVSINDVLDGDDMDVDELEQAIALYRQVESEIAVREMNRGEE